MKKLIVRKNRTFQIKLGEIKKTKICVFIGRIINEQRRDIKRNRKDKRIFS